MISYGFKKRIRSGLGRFFYVSKSRCIGRERGVKSNNGTISPSYTIVLDSLDKLFALCVFGATLHPPIALFFSFRRAMASFFCGVSMFPGLVSQISQVFAATFEARLGRLLSC